MKVSIELSPEYSEPYAIIYADKITDNIQRTLDIFGSNESPITAFKNENDIVILQPKEIYMVIVAYTVGWIGGTSSILHGIIAAIFQIALAFIIWGGFMLHYRNDVRKMNEKIKEL